MKTLDLQSELFSPTGNIAAEGAIRPLGRPQMDPLMLLVREAVQNSWDARVDDDTSVQFSLDLWTVDKEQREVLLKNVFADTPEGLALGQRLRDRAPLTALAISDRNTSGLAGPTRADALLDRKTPRNFIDFFRNIGRPADKEIGGGTYGYGKASLYVVSELHTICSLTRCQTSEGFESRLMAAALGNQYQASRGRNAQRFTGRHWWGMRAGDGVVDPLLDREADELAAAMGLPPFGRKETGTSILLLQPRCGENRSLEQAANYLVYSLLWFCWPKMLPVRRSPAMTFAVTCEGQPVSVPPPAQYPPLAEFVNCMEDIRTKRQDPDAEVSARAVEMLRPRMALGMMAIRHAFGTSGSEPMPDIGDGDYSAEAVPGRLPHHVALMRKPALIVKYLQGPPPPSDQVGYAGVFVADEALNGTFADAEPPTHDDWSYEMLEDSHAKSCVRVTHRRIDERIKEFLAPPDISVDDSSALPLGAFARQMAGLVPDVDGPGAEAQPGGGGGTGTGGKKAAKAKVRITREGRLELIDGAFAVRVGFEVDHAPRSKSTAIRAVPQVLVLDGRMKESDTPAGAGKPSVLGWFNPKGKKISGSDDVVDVAADHPGEWTVVVGIPDDAVVGVSLEVDDGEEP